MSDDHNATRAGPVVVVRESTADLRLNAERAEKKGLADRAG